MAITEDRRHKLYSKLEEVIGTENASTAMEMLPPVGWADVATKADLEHLRVMIAKEMELLELRLTNAILQVKTDLELRISRELRTFFITSLTANTAMMALVVSVAKLFG